MLSGCSASSGSVRYNKDKESEQKESSPVRFSSEEDSPEAKTYSTDSLKSDYYFSDEEDADDLPDEEPVIDLSSVMSRINSGNTSGDLSADQSSYQEKVLMEIIKYLNTPYKYGGNSKNGIDCSAFTQTIFNNTLDIPLLRTARDQYTMGIVISGREDLEFGDLVFFNTRRRVRPGHVGIYIGDNLFAHASTKHGVIVSSLDHDYYSKRFMGGRRIDGKLNARL
ncbi:MAG: C40 family peptidase [Ignavibacteriaceae bacterium]